MISKLNELNNRDNLEDGRPRNALLTHYVADNEEFMSFEPRTPQYKNLKTKNLLP